MKITKGEIAVFAIALAAFLIGACFYPYLPERMASHWNARGEVDGYMSKAWGTFLMPIVILGLGLLFMVIVRIDPLKANIEKFRKYYDGFIILFSVFLFCLNLWMLLWNIGYEFSLNIIIPIGLGFLIFYLGILCENVKRNWFIGIRTPWTLSSDVVWAKTHKIGAKLFKAVGIVILAGVFWPDYIIWLILVPILAVTVFLFVYSYVVYQKVGQIGDSAGGLNDASGNGTWDTVKAGYLRQVEKALASAGHREKKQVLEDVRSHLDQRFSELASNEQTWENMQAIITEMGPAGDYAELLESGTPKSDKKKVFVSVAVILAVVAVATIFVPHLIVKYTEIVSDRIEDNIDFPFADDPQVLGKWTSVDFVDSINDFDPGIKTWPGDLFLHELDFHENGRLIAKNEKVKRGYELTWTSGVIISSHEKTASKYHIKEIGGEKYLFYEWKSGDYTVRHRKPHYYVLKKEPVETDIAVVDFKVRGCYDDQLRAKGFYDVTASIRNKGEQQTGQFGVYFYRGDPATSKPRTHAAGPIKSGGTWNEYTGPFELNEGTNVFSVVIDPGNKVSDPDRSNNTKTITVTVKDGRIAEETITKEPLSGFVSSDKTLSHPVDFQVTSSDFIEGDWIEITKLMGTSPQIMAGERYTIQGKYSLVSRDKAKLRIYATDGETSSNQGPDVKHGQGEFMRTFTLLKEGSKNLSYLHLSFYPAGGGSSFGNTYFKQKKAADDKTVESNAQATRAVKAARAWLSLIDSGDYGASWEEAADIFKNAATKERWADMAKTVREPLGKVISRQVMSQKHTKVLPGLPPGEYVIIQFKTSFENKADTIETVTPMLDKDGIWRVSGYYIK